MTISKASVAAAFETGDKPTQTDFENLFEIIAAVPVSATFPCIIEVESTATATFRTAGALGVQMIETATTASAQTLLGVVDHSTFGAAIASAATTVAGQGVLGGGTVGIQVFEAATTASAQQALALEGAASVVHSTFGLAMASAANTAAGQGVLGGGTAGIAIFEAATTASVESQVGAAGLASPPDFISAGQTLTLDTLLVVSHTLATLPSLWTVHARCVSANIGYQVNDEIPLADGGLRDGGVDEGVTVFADASTIGITQASVFRALDKTTFNGGTVAADRWQYIFTGVELV